MYDIKKDSPSNGSTRMKRVSYQSIGFFLFFTESRYYNNIFVQQCDDSRSWKSIAEFVYEVGVSSVSIYGAHIKVAIFI